MLAMGSVTASAQDVPVDLELSPSLTAEPAVPSPAVTESSPPAATEVAPAPAQDAPAQQPPPQLATLSQVLEKVWRDNPEVRKAELAVEATGYDIRSARSGYFPYAQVQSAIGKQGEDNSVSTLYFVQPLWSGGSTVAEVDQAKARQRAAIAQLDQTRLDVGTRTLDSFLAVLQAQQQVIQWTNYVVSLKKLMERVQRRANEGVSPQSDVQTALARLRQAQAGAEANRAQLIGARAVLASLMNVTPGALEWPGDGYQLTDEQIEMADSRATQHPAHIGAVAQVDIQKAESKAAKSALWPSLSLQYRRQLEGLEFDPSNNGVVLSVQFQTSNGVRGLFGYQASEQRVRSAESSLDAIKEQIIATLKIDQAQVQATGIQLVVQQQASDAANSLVEGYLRQFDVGRRSWLDVLNVQREAHEYMLQSIALKRSYWYANGKLALDAMYWDRLVPPAANPDAVPAN